MSSRLHHHVISILLTALTQTLLINYASANKAVIAPPDEQLRHSNTAAYLGVRVDILSKELAAQLPEDILEGQGIMVSGFADNSPAQKQGLKRYDIILSYNGHPVMHPKQFISAIKNDKPNNKAVLEIIRQGKLINLPLVLSSQKYPLNADQLDYQYNMQVLGFDGMKVKMYSEDDFEAAIRYLAPDGIVRSRTFAGSYNKVYQEIYNAPDIANIAKQHLIKELSKRRKNEKGWFGDWIPFNDGNFSPDSLKNFGF